MRSLLIAPPDEQRLAEALQSGADAVVVDLPQATPATRAGARAAAALFLKEARGKAAAEVASAKGRIAAELGGARHEIEGSVAQLSAEIVRRVLQNPPQRPPSSPAREAQ